MFGVFPHRVKDRHSPLLRGFDEVFYAPNSRPYRHLQADVKAVPDLEILAESREAGVYVIITKQGREIFVTGHSEYDATPISLEIFPGQKRGLPIEIPKNYFPTTTPSKRPS